MMPRGIPFINLPVTAFLVLLVLPLTSWATNLEDVIRTPAKFHNKRVTLVAMAEVGGDRFYLYQPPKPESLGDNDRVIYGILSREGPVYDRFNNEWVEVTGTIDASYRGLVSENACSLVIERVRPLKKIQMSKANCSDHSCTPTELSRLLENPRRYEHKCVCVTGFAHVQGDAFVVYENEETASKPDFAKGVFITQNIDTPDYDHYNKQWVKLVGVVNMNQRGFADYPCGITLEKVESGTPSPQGHLQPHQ